MQPGNYGREHEMMQIRTDHPSSLEGMMESAATLDQTDLVQSNVSFCTKIRKYKFFSTKCPLGILAV
ncbi:hypothetical protein FOA24_38125 [Bacillus thuringiensis]|uniref:hypothetical protein n=1 Tax=Bacillus thuringiensis TaxID=1428 RepID=UPI003337DD66